MVFSDESEKVRSVYDCQECVPENYDLGSQQYLSSLLGLGALTSLSVS
jgi:hypothetical protein